MIKRSREVLSAYFLAVLCLLAIGLPNLNLLMSIGSILLLIGWLVTGDFKYKFSKFLNSTPALLISAVFFFHVLFLFNTDNFDYAWHDLRIKVPLLILPLVVCSLPSISNKQLRIIFYSFIAACLFATIRVYINYFSGFDADTGDTRSLVKGVSHVRLSLMVVLAMGITARLFFQFKNWRFRIPALLVIANFLFFLNLIRSATGLILVVILLMYLLIWYSQVKISPKFRWMIYAFISVSVFIGAFFLNDYYKEYYTVPDSKIKNIKEIPVYAQVEKGNYVWMNHYPKQIKTEWNKRSDIKLDGSENDIYLLARISRYMTSLNLSKDKEGVNKLTKADIENIEKGISSIEHLDMSGPELRLNKLMFEWHIYKIDGNPSGNSLTQRFEHWRAGKDLIKKSPLFGYGTGDVPDVFIEQYREMDTQLHPDYWFRAHNQFITFFVAFGIFGFVLFLLSLMYPAFHRKYRNYYLILFLIISGLSCLTEDTLETQAGVTFFSFFYAVFINYSGKRMDKE